MIWGHPWIAAATDRQGSATDQFCTLLPPPPPTLPPGLTFRCLQPHELDAERWIDLVGTRWTPTEVTGRLEGAWIPCLFDDGALVATCVLRPQKRPLWVLETLKAVVRKGYGTHLMYCIMTWLYNQNGPYHLAYTWELTLSEMVSVWARGWLASSVAIEYGWMLGINGACSFCPSTDWAPLKHRLKDPCLFQDASGSAVVSDSGLGDGWAYISQFKGTPNWTAIGTKGGWRFLWTHALWKPDSAWTWTGEFVVVGVLNSPSSHVPKWTSAEIASA